MTFNRVFIGFCVFSPVLTMEYGRPNKMWDLGYTVDETNLYYPGQRYNYTLYHDQEGYNFVDVPEPMRYWLAMYSFCMGEHGGTHLDAPFHLNENGWKPADIPVERLVGVKAVVVNVEAEVFSLPDPRNFVVEPRHFEEHERLHGKIPVEGVVMVHTGWERYWPDKKKYWGIDANGTFNFPGLSQEAAKWLVENRKVVGVGIDTQSMDIGNLMGEHVVAAHVELLGSDAYLLENLVLRELVQDTTPERTDYTQEMEQLSTSLRSCDLRVIVMPIKSKGSGGPVRVIAYCQSSTPQLPYYNQ